MLEHLTEFLNGPHAAIALNTLHVALLLAMLVFLCKLAFAGRRGKAAKGGASFRGIEVAIGIALFAVLIYQGTWQLAGFRSRGLMQFMRGHNPRVGAADKQILRGAIRDRNGTPLARTLPESTWKRAYPLGPAAAHVVGYAHPIYGWSGVERAADAALSGYGIADSTELSQLGKNMLDLRRPEGSDVYVTIDAQLQRAAYDLLARRGGAVVVLRPSDGAILAMASSPSFNPVDPSSGMRSGNAAMLNRAAQGLYPPGSTFKIAMALMAVDIGKTPRFDCPAEGFRADPKARPIRDSEYTSWKRDGRVWKGWGVIGLGDAFAHSSNVYFARLGVECGADQFNSLVDRLGFRENVVFYDGGSGVIQANPANIPRLDAGDRRPLAQMSIGQGEMLLAPLHVAMLTSVVANHGVLVPPRMGAAPPKDEKTSRRVVSAKAADTIAGYMRDAVRRGTGRGADIPGLEVCGKTGTAQAPGGADHAWFTCFAPRSNPKIVVTVIVERGGYGAKSAIPVARAVLEKAVESGIVQP